MPGARGNHLVERQKLTTLARVLSEAPSLRRQTGMQPCLPVPRPCLPVPPQGRGKSADTAFRQTTGQGCLIALDFSLRKEGRSRSRMRIRVAAEVKEGWSLGTEERSEKTTWTEGGKLASGRLESKCRHIRKKAWDTLWGAGAGLNLLMLYSSLF